MEDILDSNHNYVQVLKCLILRDLSILVFKYLSFILRYSRKLFFLDLLLHMI